ncbi:hypothetical protein ACVWZR_007962 [Bradyrhizobium sp. i1.3.1]
MSAYRALIVGLHDRPIRMIHMDCIDDEAAISSAERLVDGRDVELWQMDRPVAQIRLPVRDDAQEVGRDIAEWASLAPWDDGASRVVIANVAKQSGLSP